MSHSLTSIWHLFHPLALNAICCSDSYCILELSYSGNDINVGRGITSYNVENLVFSGMNIINVKCIFEKCDNRNLPFRQ